MSTNRIADTILPASLLKSANNLSKQELANALMPVDSIGANYGLWIAFGGTLLVVALIAIGVALYYRSMSHTDSPWWSDRARTAINDWNLFRSHDASTDDSPAPTSVLSNTHSEDLLSKVNARAARVLNKAKKPEAWCFVGEDLEGRWCVQVPSREACDANRVFGSREDCEFVPANALPSGIVNSTATSMTPLSARPLEGRSNKAGVRSHRQTNS